MSTPVIDRQDIPLLGKEERAEQLIAWSERSKPGKRWTKDFAFGLRLSFVSNDLTPDLYLHWNPVKFRSWLEKLGEEPEQLYLVEYGIAVDHSAERTLVTLLGAGEEGQVLWDTRKSFCYQQSRPEEKASVNWLLGMVSFTEDGPVFRGVPETQSQLKEASALAVIEDKPKTAPVLKAKEAAKLGQVIPIQKQVVSDKARAFLLRDILLNRLVAKTG